MNSLRLFRSRWQFVPLLAALLLWAGGGEVLQGANLAITNASFEADQFTQADRFLTVKVGAPSGWTGVENMPGQQLGQFENLAPGQTPANNPKYIDNANGNQLVFMSSDAGVLFYQELSTVYQVGQRYSISLLAEAGNGTSNGAILQFRLYFLRAGVKVSVATGEAVYQAKPGNITHLNFYQGDDTTLSAQDRADMVGKKIGVEVASTTTNGGYWDIDDVRATVTPVPEPATAILLLGGLGALGARRRRAPRHG